MYNKFNYFKIVSILHVNINMNMNKKLLSEEIHDWENSKHETK